MAIRNAKLFIASDEMSASLRRVEITTAACQTLADVEAELKHHKVIFGVDLSQVEDWFDSDDEEDLIVAKGEFAKNGRNGFLKFNVSVSAKPEFVPDADVEGGTLDFKTAMRVPVVNANDVLAEYIPPTKGDIGTNIFGGNITPLPGEPIRVSVGDGVVQQGNNFLAKSAGTPSFKDSIIAVKRIFEVDQVSYESGNIEFPGTVIVRGDVLEGFEIKANEHVVVQGVINGAKVSAGGYIQCLGGILGKGKTELAAGEFIEARHVDSAVLIADGDITITKDMLHCTTHSLGMVNCGGAIIGGEMIALKGVECTELGSEVGTKTTVFIRKHYRQEKAKDSILELLHEVNEIYDRYKRVCQIKHLSLAELEALQADGELVRSIVQKKSNFDKLVGRFDKIIKEVKNPTIKINKILWSDVVMGGPFSKHASLEKQTGSITVRENDERGVMDIQRG